MKLKRIDELLVVCLCAANMIREWLCHNEDDLSYVLLHIKGHHNL